MINDVRGNGADGNPYQSVNNAIHDNTIIHATDTAVDGFFCYQIISTPTNANNTWQNDLYITPNATRSWWNFRPPEQRVGRIASVHMGHTTIGRRI